MSVLLVSLSFVVLDVERDVPEANIRTAGDALWWAITTSTTVGYGDQFPVTPTGRVLGGVVMLCGIALLGVVTASIASWFVRADADADAAELQTPDVATALVDLRAEVAALRAELLHDRKPDPS